MVLTHHAFIDDNGFMEASGLYVRNGVCFIERETKYVGTTEASTGARISGDEMCGYIACCALARSSTSAHRGVTSVGWPSICITA